MLLATLALVAAAGATFYFSWSVVHDLSHDDLSHTRCAPPTTRRERPATFWFIVSLYGCLALLFAGFALESAWRFITAMFAAA